MAMLLQKDKAFKMLTTFSNRLPLKFPITLGFSDATTRRLCAFSSASSSHSIGGISMVQGASRGLGLEFVKQLLERNETEQVFATCRNPNSSSGLLDLREKFPDRLAILPLDLTNETTIEETAEAVREKHGFLNLLINASGVLSIPNVMQPETSLSKLEKSSLMAAYEVNAVGPILVTKHMWPLLRAGSSRGNIAVVANLSARVGSIEDNHLGGWHSYRASKAALNQLSKTAAVEFGKKKNGVICVMLHPGTVDTDLSKPFQRNVPKDKLFTKEYSVSKLLQIINGASLSDNGKFFAWDGQLIPW